MKELKEFLFAIVIGSVLGLSVFGLVFYLSGCRVYTTDLKRPDRPPFNADSGAPDNDPDDDCKLSCAQWRALHCPEANPSPSGASCEVVCRNAADAGIDTAKQLGCASQAQDCAALRGCPY